ncbi:GNAT family N-acetyltransferase [Celerinatantimonas sp. MCCC 1A17872]|uniref:GNAT family N-acetyltransferase n=1 Tax=Celerinatantimonas sp. MCCC 1A17872 TaxID=3177514 RepID=UPI0038CA7AAE
MTIINQYGQAIGYPLPHWSACSRPQSIVLQGQYCRLEPLNVQKHAQDLFDAYSSATDERDWTYMFTGPFHTIEELTEHLQQIESCLDPKRYVVIDSQSNKAVGSVALMRIDSANGVVEVGNVAFSPALQKTIAATEAQFLLMRYVFEQLHYRRYEWKCDSLNEPSKAAALRLGFSFEGIFRQAAVYNGRSRDTSWYAMIDKDWPMIRDALINWLAPNNFNHQGQQQQSLSDIRMAQQRR